MCLTVFILPLVELYIISWPIELINLFPFADFPKRIPRNRYKSLGMNTLWCFISDAGAGHGEYGFLISVILDFIKLATTLICSSESIRRNSSSLLLSLWLR